MKQLDLSLAQTQDNDVIQIKSGLRKITRMNPMQHGICSMISNVLIRPESIDDNLKKLWHEIDSDSNGIIT